MSLIGFPIYNSFRGSWVPEGITFIQKPNGIIGLGYQGITDNSTVSLNFGSKKSHKSHKSHKSYKSHKRYKKHKNHKKINSKKKVIKHF